MTPRETVMLTEYVRACCPQQQIAEYTPDAWHDLLGDLDLAECKAAVAAVCKRQPFVSPAEIRAEIRRIHADRLARTPLPAPSADAADKPGRYLRIVRDNVERIANDFSDPGRLGLPPGKRRPEGPPAEWTETRRRMGHKVDGEGTGESA